MTQNLEAIKVKINYVKINFFYMGGNPTKSNNKLEKNLQLFIKQLISLVYKENEKINNPVEKRIKDIKRHLTGKEKQPST